MQDNRKGKSYCNYYRELSSTIYYLCPFGASIWFSLTVMQLSNPNSSLLAEICPSTVPENRTCSVGWRTIAVIPSIWAWVPLIIPDIKSQNCKRKRFNQVINLLELNIIDQLATFKLPSRELEMIIDIEQPDMVSRPVKDDLCCMRQYTNGCEFSTSSTSSKLASRLIWKSWKQKPKAI